MNEKKVEVQFYLDEAGRKDSLAQGGDGKRDQVAQFDLTPAWLSLASVKDDGQAVVDLRYPVEGYRWETVVREYRKGDDFPDLRSVEWEQTKTLSAPPIGGAFDHVPDEAELLSAAKAVRAAEETKAARAAMDREIRAGRRDYATAQERFEAANADFYAAQAALREEERRRQEERSAEREAQRRSWIEAHGSERLRLAVANGYRHKRIYVEERLALDFPGYIADHENIVEEDRFNPSLEALQEVERLKAVAETDSEVTEPEVEWLPYGMTWGEDEDSDEAVEAVRFILDGVYCYKVF